MFFISSDAAVRFGFVPVRFFLRFSVISGWQFIFPAGNRGGHEWIHFEYVTLRVVVASAAFNLCFAEGSVCSLNGPI